MQSAPSSPQEKGSEYYLHIDKKSPSRNKPRLQTSGSHPSANYGSTRLASDENDSDYDDDLSQPLMQRLKNSTPDKKALKTIAHMPDLEPFVRTNQGRYDGDASASVMSPFQSSPAATPIWRLFSKTRNDSDLGPVQEPRPGVCSKLCSYVRAGSVRGSAFNLCSATLGAGALSIPVAFKRTGMVLGCVLLLLGSLATIFSIYLLLIARKATKKDSYEDLTVFMFGKFTGIIVEINIIIFCFGAATSYIVAIGDILSPILASGILPFTWLTKDVLTVIFWAVIMLPLSMVEKVNSLTWTSMFGVCSILFLVFAVMYHSITTVVDEGWGHVSLYHMDTTAVTALPIIMFAFTCQVNVFSVQMELERPTNSRMRRVTKYAIAVCFFIYLGMGVFGYLDFLDKTDGNILKNFDLKGFKSSEDVLIGFAYLAITMTVVLAFPLNIFPIRFTLEFMIYGKDHEASKLQRIIMTTLICSAALGVALAVPSINIVFQLLGGTSSAFVCFVLPAAFAIKLGVGSLPFKIGVWSLFIGGIVAGVGSTVITVNNIIG